MNSVQKIIVKAGGHKEPFDPLKLASSLSRAGAGESAVKEIVSHIEGELKDGMSTGEIYNHAFFLLRKMKNPAVMRYSLKRAVMDLGPSGFPFEGFIGEIFRQKGFEVKTDQIVQGHCVEHEVDVVAWNENKLIMCEAKFHNELGVKSDLKVALYVKARFEDLSFPTFHYGKDRKLDEGWLVTNTKFTTSAIQYGQCQNLRMIGWNYPAKGNLHDMIEDSGLHPLTCLGTLTRHDQNELLKQGVVLCKTLAENKDLLKTVGLSDAQIASVIEEIKSL